jgi:thiosulfate/3-mercaptopyruvate sulfurtransferase
LTSPTEAREAAGREPARASVRNIRHTRSVRSREFPSSAPLAGAAWLAERLGRPWLHVVDCRWELGNPEAGRLLYGHGHIPGAAFMDLDRDLSGPRFDGPNGQGRHPLPAPGAFAAAARRAGITRTGIVVAYDQGMTGGAARLWWLLRHIGKREVVVLAGGLPAWPGELEAGEPAIAPGDLEAGKPVGARLADHAAVEAATAGRTATVVDARAPERYRGELEPIDPVAGHVPGARSAPASEPLPEWLAEDPRPLIAYCGSGVSACVTLLQLAAAGREDAQLYAGSWSDWVARGLPVATGED